MSNSPLVQYTKISPNRTANRNHAIDTITIHCVVGHGTMQSIGDWFAKSTTQASSNYLVDDQGRVAMYVEEKDRSWCTSSGANDNRAVTIEVSSDATAPYKVTDGALQGIIKLCADICQRNNIKQLMWRADKNLIGQTDKQNLTVHRWFANKSCPGDYLYGKYPYIVDEVNKLLLGGATVAPEKPAPTPVPAPSNPFAPYLVTVTASALNYRKGPGTTFPVVGSVKKGEVYTIVEEASGTGASKWGKLKSGAGWVSLDYVQKR